MIKYKITVEFTDDDEGEDTEGRYFGPGTTKVERAAEYDCPGKATEHLLMDMGGLISMLAVDGNLRGGLTNEDAAHYFGNGLNLREYALT